MAVLESKPYNLGISLTPYHFSYDNGKLVGISKLNDAGNFIPVDPSTNEFTDIANCLLYTSPSPRDLTTSRMPSSA